MKEQNEATEGTKTADVKAVEVKHLVIKPEHPAKYTELESMQRILHLASGLYCEHGHGPHKKETHIFLSQEDNVPLQICKSALEVAAFLGGYSRAVAVLSLVPRDCQAHKLLDDTKTDETRLVFNSWTCSFCGGTYADRELAIKHALECDDNEDVHACATCASYAIGEDTGDGYRHICNGNNDRIDTWMRHCPEWIGA